MNETQSSHIERRIAQSRSAQFKRYLGTMEGEVGQSQKKMHEILSEHMRLKAELLLIADQVEELEIARAELMNEQDVSAIETILERLVLAYSTPAYRGLGKYVPAGLSLEQSEALVRTLRYALMQIKKAQVEVQSMPLLLGVGCGLSLVELEALLCEVEKCPDWDMEFKQLAAHKGVSGKWISFMEDPETRRALVEFAQALMAAQILEEGILAKLESTGAEAQGGVLSLALNLNDAAMRADLIKGVLELATLIHQNESVTGWDKNEVTLALREAASQVLRVQEMELSLQTMQKETGVPIPKTLAELTIFHAVVSILEPKLLKRERMSAMFEQRRPSFLEKAPRVKIATWKDRADSLNATRAKLERLFKLDDLGVNGQKPDAASLRHIVEGLVSRGMFHSMSTRFKEAEKAFHALAVSSSKKWTAIEMSDSLQEWATWLDQCRQFETQPDFVAIFGPAGGSATRERAGVNIPFDSCLELLSWQDELKTLLLGDEAQEKKSFSLEGEDQERLDTASYRRDLLAYLTSPVNDAEFVALASLERWASLVKSPAFKKTEIQVRADFAKEKSNGIVCKEWNDMISLAQTRADYFKKLQASVERVGLREGVMLLEVAQLQSELEELEFMITRLEQYPLLSQPGALMSEIYLGLRTDLSVLDTVKDYLRFLRTSSFPQAVKQQLISQFGPARLKENQAWVGRIRQNLVAVTEHFSKIEETTSGRILRAELSQRALDELAQGLDLDLKFSQELPSVVEAVTLEAEARVLGLELFLNWLKQRQDQDLTQIIEWDVKKVFRLAWHSSLLRVGMLGAKV